MVWYHSFPEYSRLEYDNLLIEGMIDFVGNVRRSNADRSVGTSRLL